MQSSIIKCSTIQTLGPFQQRVPVTRTVAACKWRLAGRKSNVARAEPENKPDGSFESLFSKELQRRGLSMDESDTSGEGPGASGSSPSGTPSASGSAPSPASGTNPFAFRDTPKPASAGTSTRTRPRSAPPPMAADAIGSGAPSSTDNQRQRSIDMVTEGLEGLLPRAKLLLTLGGSVFLGFLPFMLAFSLLFTGIYSVFGDSFLHGGRTGSGPPAYIDPERLLSEPTVDPYIPYNSNPYTAPDLQ